VQQKKTKPRLFGDIVANQDLWLPGLEYFFGWEWGMHELADYAKPCFEKLIVKQRKKAMKAIRKIKSDIQDQYNKELKDSRKEIAVDTNKAFLKTLKFRRNDDPNKVRGLENGILVCDRDTSMPMHILPKQNLLYKGDTKGYFPNNNLSEKTAANEVGNSFAGSFEYRDVILNGEQTYPSKHNKHYFQFHTYKAFEDNGLPTRELKGVFEGKPVLLSRFEELPTFSILADMIKKQDLTLEFIFSSWDVSCNKQQTCFVVQI